MPTLNNIVDVSRSAFQEAEVFNMFLPLTEQLIGLLRGELAVTEYRPTTVEQEMTWFLLLPKITSYGISLL